MERTLHTLLNDKEIAGKMLVVCGPRQVGKTHLSQQWLVAKACSDFYYNWDDENIRRQFQKDPHFFESQVRQKKGRPRVVLDEIHKLSRWKTVLKGFYDSFKKDFDFLITGSARLEYFNSSGDSMLGRYHLLHLGPVLPHEMHSKKIGIRLDLVTNPLEALTHLEQTPIPQDFLEQLLIFSGFPDPLIKASTRSLNLWHKEYKRRLLREDLRDLTRIQNLPRAEHFFDLLLPRMGAPLSLNSLREDLLCSHDATRVLLLAFEKLAIVFSVRPYAKRIQNSLQKEPKVYFYDWSLAKNEGARFESWMAVFLKSWCDMVNDGGWGDVDLFYIRDKQKREVDFLITNAGTPWILIQAKTSFDSEAHRQLEYFSQALKVPLSFCVTREENVFKKISATQMTLSANRFVNLFFRTGLTCHK